APLKIPLVHGVVRSTPPYEILTFTFTFLATVRVDRERMSETIGLVVQSNPKKIDGTVTLVLRKNRKLVEITYGIWRYLGIGLLGNDSRTCVIARNDNEIQGPFQTFVERSFVECTTKGLFQKRLHLKRMWRQFAVPL
ncbi:amino-acid n-acetyltransferase, partial [Moniliophthora roreri]